MRKRAEHVEATRQRIVDATVHLHSTVGPANTTISAIAEQAGVTRLTVYRHFPDEEALYAACMPQWGRQHPAPDPATWRAIPGVGARARQALRELYGWYRDHGHALLPIYRDLDAMPAAARQATRDGFQQFADALVAGSGVRGHARRRLRAAAGHVVDFWTWHSLCVEQNLDDTEAADLAALLVTTAAGRHQPPD